jgi:hypothetical protein
VHELALKQRSVSEEIEAEVSRGWDRTVRYFRARGGVLFLSESLFWERHGFVQQSIARALAAEGIPVTWLDGMDWRWRRPHVSGVPANLEVRQLISLPGRRFPQIEKLAVGWQAAEIRRRLTAGGRKAVFWVQSGLPEAIVDQVPYVDVFSVFDVITGHSPQGPLCRKAALVLCQNRTALAYMQGLGEKALLAFPPMDLSPNLYRNVAFDPLPKNFPKQVMGYIGSFGAGDFDFVLFENFIRSLPDHGFVLAGRTDLEGMEEIARLRSYPNFCHVPWVPRDQLRSLWERLSVTLLLYRGHWRQDGAFATKALESAYFGVPCVSTITAKTEDLAQFFPQAGDFEGLREAALRSLNGSADACARAYRHFTSRSR